MVITWQFELHLDRKEKENNKEKQILTKGWKLTVRCGSNEKNFSDGCIVILAEVSGRVFT